MILNTLLTCVALSIIWHRVGAFIRNYFVKKTLALNEYEEIGTKRAGGKIKGTAVIAGGSIGGLWAARFASDHFDDVVVVEPETWTVDDDGMGTDSLYDEEGNATDVNEPKRTRVFQYDAVHGFQGFKLAVLRKTFPGFDEEAIAANISLASGYAPAAISGVVTSAPSEYYAHTRLPQSFGASRAGYERLLRKLVRRDCPQIRWVNGSVTGLVPSADRKHISEVVVQRTGEEGEVREKATLVVDATGGSMSGLRWLKAQSYGLKTSPEVKDDLTFDSPEFRKGYDPKMRYRCMSWAVPAELRDKLPTVMGYDDTNLVYNYFPDANVERRNSIFLKTEGHRIRTGWGGWDVPFDEMPKTPAQITSWLKDVRGTEPVAPWVFSLLEMLNTANGYGPDDEIPYQDYRAPPCTYAQYQRVSDLPSNFVALGDATMRVNPIWGQGCLKALIGALSLHHSILHTSVHTSEKGDRILASDFGRKFFALQAPKIEGLWDGTKNPDYGWATTVPVEGETLQTGKVIRLYAQNAVKFSHYDRELNYIMFLQRNFLAPGTDLFAPHVALKVLWFALTSRFYSWSEPEKYRVHSPVTRL